MEDLPVLYLPDAQEWDARCAAMRAAGFQEVRAFNTFALGSGLDGSFHEE